jgi:hypothetical protein
MVQENDDVLSSALRLFWEYWDAQVAEAGMASSEHAVHFCLALALQATLSLNPGSIVFERPVGRKRVDLWLRPPSDIAFEVKFHREIPSGRNRPFTQHYGSMLADLNKLSGVPARRRIFILVGDTKAANYLQNSGQGLMSLSQGGTTAIPAESLDRLSPTARGAAERHGPWAGVTTELLWSKRSDVWNLFAWEVRTHSDHNVDADDGAGVA